MRLVITEPAENDLKSIVRYITAQNPGAAERVYREIRAAAFGLIEFPQKGRAGRVTDTRELILADLPFAIVYNVTKDEVIWLGVFHLKMDLTKRIEDRKKEF